MWRGLQHTRVNGHLVEGNPVVLTEDKTKENGDPYARLNLAFLEILKENEIYLNSVEEVQKVMEGISKNSATTYKQEHLSSMNVGQSLSVVIRGCFFPYYVGYWNFYLLYGEALQELVDKRKAKDRKTGSGREGFTNSDMYGLRYTTSSLITWNAELHENVLRDLELTIPNYLHITEALFFFV